MGLSDWNTRQQWSAVLRVLTKGALFGILSDRKKGFLFFVCMLTYRHGKCIPCLVLMSTGPFQCPFLYLDQWSLIYQLVVY